MGDTDEQEEKVPAHPLVPTRWTLKRIRSTFDCFANFTLSGVWKALRSMKIRLRRGYPQQYSPDPNYKAKEEKIHGILQEVANSKGLAVAIFLDEFSYYHWPLPGSDWTIKGQTPIAQRANSGEKYHRVVGALNAQTGKVAFMQAPKIGITKLKEFFIYLDSLYPNVERIFVILDNWPVHFNPKLTKVIEQLDRIELVPLPTYAPWLNPIEKLWLWLKKDVIRNHSLAGNWASIKHSVDNFLNYFKDGSDYLLSFVGLLGNGKFAQILQGS